MRLVHNTLSLASARRSVLALAARPVVALATRPVLALATRPVLALATRPVLALATRPVLALAALPILLGACGGTFELEERLELAVDESQLPAIVAGVADGTEILSIEAAGVRSVDDPVPAQVTDPFHLGSNTKAMTAALVARYVERGTLRWDSTVAELFPDVAVDPGFEDVTVTDLLSHIGGAPGSRSDVMSDSDWLATFTDTAPLDEQRAAATADILARPPAVEPGQFEYSNAGYVIVGAALERLTGATWEALMREDVFDPLGMTDCGFGAPSNERDDAPVGHVSNGGNVAVAPEAPFNDNPAFIGPAGTVYCTAESWVRFLQAHLRADDGPYLTASSWDTLHRPNDDGYALGWAVAERGWSDGRVYSHSGSNTMWYSVTWLAPNIDRIYFAMTNAASADAEGTMDAIIGDLIQDAR